MRIIKACSLVGILMLALSSSMFADSVSYSDAVAAYQTTSAAVSQNWSVFESSKVLQSEFNAGQTAYLLGIAFQAAGLKGLAQDEFKTAVYDFSQVANGLSAAVPDAGALGLLACTGLLLAGSLKRKFSR
jgi:hypothetical protein